MGYYIEHNQRALGPFEDYELLANGVTASTLVWRQGMEKWQPAGSLPELTHLFPASSATTTTQFGQTTPPPFPHGTPPPIGQTVPPYGQQSYGQYQQTYTPKQTAVDDKKVDFGQAISICFKKYADFSGRARRSEFWWWTLFATLLGFFTGLSWLVTMIPSLAVGARRLHDTGRSGWWQLLPFIPSGIMLVQLFPFIGYLMKNDFTYNYSTLTAYIGSFVVLSLITFIAQIILIVFWAQDSEQGDNQYGPSVKY